jgi:predicted fused transcriptional regulator/phosphomethylpyrimidine kinase/predicted transcriptional regulator
MILPEEIVANRVLPTVRTMIAVRLTKRGLRERAVAACLGVTQSAVSKYLRGRIRPEPAVAEAETFRSLADTLAEGLAEGRMSPFEAMGRVVAAIRKEEDRGLVCRLHEEAMPSLVGLGCDLCVRVEASERLVEEEVLGGLRQALRTLEALPAFVRLIPNVGSNLAQAKGSPRTIRDVAAVPGRIFEMRGAVRVPAAPEFGASRHVAETVLAVTHVHPSVRAALNVRWSEDLRAALRTLGWKAVEFDPAYEGRAAHIAATIRRHKGRPDVLYHRGAFGIEPMAYVVAESATAVVERVRVLLDALAKAPRVDEG